MKIFGRTLVIFCYHEKKKGSIFYLEVFSPFCQTAKKKKKKKKIDEKSIIVVLSKVLVNVPKSYEKIHM